MSVFIPIPIAELEQADSLPSRTYRLDLENGRIFSAGSCDGLDAVCQFIKKAVITPRFRCAIYDNQYGSEIKQAIIAGDVTPEYIDSEVPEYVKGATLFDGRVRDMYRFTVRTENELVHIRCRSLTTFGETIIDEVIFCI